MTKNCETLIQQTHRKAEKTLEYKMTKPGETFYFNSPINLGAEFDWMIGMIILYAYISNFKTTEESNKFEHHEFLVEKSGGCSYEKVRDEIEKKLGNFRFYSYLFTRW